MINIWLLDDEERAKLKVGTWVTAGENNPGVWCGVTKGGTELVVWRRGLKKDEFEEKIIAYRKLAGNYGTLKDLVNECHKAVSEAAEDAKEVAAVIRGRHILYYGKNGNKVDFSDYCVTKGQLSQKLLRKYIQDAIADGADEIYFEAAHDGADTVHDMAEYENYEPFVSCVDVLLWSKKQPVLNL